MWRLFSHSPLPLLLFLLFSFSFSSPCVSSTNEQHYYVREQNLIPPPKSNMDPQELQLLFKIMDNMSSDYNWRISHPNPCSSSSWVGIECRAFGPDNRPHVTRLDFGTFPNPTCNPTATFPSDIFHLPHLESVFFIHCFTHTTTRISLSEANNFSSPLQQLSLRSNPALIGSIPPHLSSLKSLQILTLSSNSLNGSIPPEIFTFTSLLHLDLSYNMLSSPLPSQLGNLRNLVGLDLSYNRLWGSIPETIGQLGMLQKLDLSSNALTGNIPESIGKLQSLSFLALSNNRLTGKFPKGLSQLQSLQYFIMDDNPMFTSLPVEFGQLQKLQELRLANSGYSGTIPTTFSLLNNLTTLSLQNNRLTGQIPVELANLSHIYHLNLSRNLLGGVVPFNSSFLRRLGKNLDLSENPGLCLSPSEANNGVYSKVDICGRNKTDFTFNKSQASSQLSIPLSSIAAFSIVGMLPYFFSV
ncbi:PREDICTED: LRR receptor-like serine/threonine-protein kinase FLS2 [Ipomoea nil]|uniref:LRR receptor-like serine/threonine-protein kinase FLS2 n=1 Tax=Ipomoea nil TaxID=35883 RepID=UPI000900AA19|nr:PREDICTED: LRR receptor-like serine/threonine-protein kinase FLS2 [Ipomoea nil]